jgi:2-(1,2-epoxy-1,2-dihydrophenyl)acetyl-CoA isomerase
MSVVQENLENNVFTITLNRADKKNSMSLELLQGLYNALMRAEEKNPAIVIIRGAGATFCSGGDVIEFRDSPEPDVQIDAMADFLHKSIVKIRRMNAIVLAVVEGLAFGAGLSLSLACDLTVAEKGAIMNMAYRRIGLTPDGGGSIFLPILAGMKRFNEFYLFSSNIDAQKAQEIGLVNFVFSAEELEEKLKAVIDQLIALPLETIGSMKGLVNATLLPMLETQLDRERRLVAEFSKKKEFQERLAILFKKR